MGELCNDLSIIISSGFAIHFGESKVFGEHNFGTQRRVPLDGRKIVAEDFQNKNLSTSGRAQAEIIRLHFSIKA
jgi:hypothetical protein